MPVPRTASPGTLGRFSRAHAAQEIQPMKIEGAHDIPAPRQKVWDAFLDPEQLRQAIPGCEKLEALGNDEFKAVMKIGVAAVKGTFEGKVRLADKKAPDSCAARRSSRCPTSRAARASPTTPTSRSVA